MTFGDNTRNKSTQPKRRSILGSLFSPNIGASIRPLGDVANMFVTLLAMVFVMNGLLPKDHPAVTGQNPNAYSLNSILRDAHQRLSYTKDGLPKVVLFFAVVGCLVFSILTVLTFILSMFVGTAHADTLNGYFTVDPTTVTNDLAQAWLAFLFKGGAFPGCGVTTTECSAHAIQDSLQVALGFYSQAVLIFAAIILFYHLTAMIVHTAHHGVPMGKNASQIWAPIRLVVAIALLVPVGSGLNSGQNLVIQIATWGSALASNVWVKFVGAIATDFGGSYANPATPIDTSLAESVLEMQVCKYLYNYYVWDAEFMANPTAGITPNPDYSSRIIPITPTAEHPTETKSPAGQLASIYRFGPPPADSTTTPNDPVIQNICGSITVAPPAAGNAMTNALGAAMNAAQNNALTEQLLVDTDDVAKAIWPCFVPQAGYPDVVYSTSPRYIPTNTAASDCPHINPTSVIAGLTPQLVEGTSDDNTSSNIWNNFSGASGPASSPVAAITANYVAALNTQIASAFSQVGTQNTTSIALSTSYVPGSTLGGSGWIAAGAYFNDISKIQGEIETAVRADTPKAHGDAVTEYILTHKLEKEHQSYFNYISKDLAKFREWMNKTAPVGTTPPDPLPSSGSTCDISNTIEKIKPDLTSLALKSGEQPIDLLFRGFDDIASLNCLWQTDSSGNFRLGVVFDDANPFAEISHFGHINLNLAYDLFQMAMVADVAPGTVSLLNAAGAGIFTKYSGMATSITKGILSIVGTTGAVIGSILATIALIFFIAGFSLAFFVPLIPFITFFFASLSWIALLLEAIVMMPLVALAHLNPEGDGLPTAGAKVAYSFIFNIMLRPTLMIFGLICGLLVFLSAVFLLNQLFLITALGADGNANGHVVMAHIVFSLMYVVLVYISANNAFKLINIFPDHAMGWMGQQAKVGPGIGSANELQGIVPAASGYFGQQLSKGISDNTTRINQGLQSFAQNRISNAVAEKNANAADVAKISSQYVSNRGDLDTEFRKNYPNYDQDGFKKTLEADLALGGKGIAKQRLGSNLEQFRNSLSKLDP